MRVRAELDRLRPELPPGTVLEINLDRSTFIEESMHEVVVALGIALTLVLAVIYLFLGNLRAMLIPAVTIPVSIIAAFIVMAAMGFSINILTLLGLVLAIGLVVDDSIIVLENIYRRVEGGEAPLLASVEGSREIGFAVIATTLVLMAVFVPISFLQGNIGKLFREFGFTIAAAVAFSSLVALTLTPMLSSKLLSGGARHSRFAELVDGFFRRLASRYEATLRRVMRRPWLVVAGMLVAACCRGDAVPLDPERARAARGSRHDLLRADGAGGIVARVHGPPRPGCRRTSSPASARLATWSAA